MTFTFKTLTGEEFQMEQSTFQKMYDSGMGSDEERSHLMMQALEQQSK